MLLLTNILRSRYRGVIHLHLADADEPPEIEFSGGEGPQEVMNQIQDYAVPEIRKQIEPLGSCLRWEELDLEAGVVRRHRSPFHDRFEFVLCPDELGIELILPIAGPQETPGRTEAEEGPRPWVPLRPLAEPGDDHRATIGWAVEPPTLRWRHLQTRYAPPAIEITWSCASLPAHWATPLLAETKTLDCRLDGDQRCPMHPTRDGLLVYRGLHPSPDGVATPATLSVRLEQPLLVVGPDPEVGQDHPLADTPEDRHRLDQELAATVDALDFRALIDGRPTRLIADADLDRSFEAEVLTAEGMLLPETIPAGMIPGLPWDVRVSRRSETSIGMPSRDEDQCTAAEAENRQGWRLVPRPQGDPHGQDSPPATWRDVTWEGAPPALGFGLGAYQASCAPRITHIKNRRASVAWRIEANDPGGMMCLCVPHWVPVGCPGQVALPARDNGFDYAAEVRTSLDGLEERFVIDQGSEVPTNRLFLDPRGWRFRDQRRGPIKSAEALGEGGGRVRWRRSPSDTEAREQELRPTDWAGGSAPVLLLPKDDDTGFGWGGLYAPATVPWDALEDVVAEPTPESEEVLFVPRSPPEDRTSAIWIDLWGFICRYDPHQIAFARSHGETSKPTAWIARAGLELFPRRNGHLLRSFSPIYAVRAGGTASDLGPRTFSLLPTSPRPTLHIGRDVDASDGSLALELGTETYARCQLANPGEVPEIFEPGRVPGTPLRLDRVGRQVAWFAVEQRSGTGGRRAGYLLSWDAEGGWLFRGFFTHRDTAVELGEVRQGDQRRRVFLGGEAASRVSAFRLTIDRQGDHWSAGAPPEATRETTSELIRAWESDHFVPERRPLPLRAHGLRIVQQAVGERPWIFEFFAGESRADRDLPAGIRLWQLHGEADEALADDARELGEDPTEKVEPPIEPERRILRADDDDDF